MLLSDLATYCINETGQLIIGGLSDMGISMSQFWSVVQQELLEYQRFSPLTKKFNIYMMSGSQYVYDFTSDINNVGYIDGANPGVVPHRITKMVPTGQQQTVANWLSYRSGGAMGGVGSSMRVPTPRMFLPRYRAPKLYCTEYGQFDVEAQYRYLVNEIVSPSANVTASFVFSANRRTAISIALPLSNATPISQGSVQVLFGGVLVATDASGSLVFTPALQRNYKGSISYSTGNLVLTATDIPVDNTAAITVEYGTMIDVDIQGLDHEAKVFLDLVSAKFMVMNGRIRRAFTQTDLAMTTDADALVEEGLKLYDEARARMLDRCKFYKAIRP